MYLGIIQNYTDQHTHERLKLDKQLHWFSCLLAANIIVIDGWSSLFSCNWNLLQAVLLQIHPSHLITSHLLSSIVRTLRLLNLNSVVLVREEHYNAGDIIANHTFLRLKRLYLCQAVTHSFNEWVTLRHELVASTISFSAAYSTCPRS